MSKSTKYVLIISIAFLCIFSLRGKISGIEFDSYQWKYANLNSENYMSLRWDMINSLRNNYDLIGMSKSDIIKLLGKPEESSQTETFNYYLGYSHTGINTGSLTIKFSKDTVESISVWQG